MCAHKISPIIFRIPTERLWSKTLNSQPQKTKVAQIVTAQLLRSLQSILTQRSCILLFAKLWFQNGKIILTATFFIWISTNFYTQFRRKAKERRYALLHSLTSSWVLLTGLRRRVLALLQKIHIFPQLLLLTSFRYYITLLLRVFIKIRTPLLKWYQNAKHSLKIATQLSLFVSHFLKSYSYYFFNKVTTNLLVIPPRLKPLFQQVYYYKFILIPTPLNLNIYNLKTLKVQKFLSLSNTLLCKYLVNLQFCKFFVTVFSASILKNKNFSAQSLFQSWAQKTTVNKFFSVSWPSSSLMTLGISTFFLKLRNRAFQQIFRLSGTRYWWGGHSGVTLRCSLLNIIFFVLKQNIYTSALNISLQNRLKIFCRLHWEKIRVVKNLPNIPVWRQAKYVLDYIIFARSLFLIRQQTQPFSTSSTLILLDNISNYLSVNLLLVQDKLLARLGRRIRRKFVRNTIRASIVAVLINSASFLARHLAEELSLLKRHFIFLNGFRRILRAVLLDIPLFSMFRLVVVGKVGGAKRTKKYILQLGPKTALNSIQNSVDFAQRSVETIYGSIGLKVWVAKSVYEIT